MSDARRLAAAKRFLYPDTVFYVEMGLDWKWSPQQISAVCMSQPLFKLFLPTRRPSPQKSFKR
ncbi:hypothetical protein BIY26_22390 [Brenneria goodwinii]|uniref:Uncharacterized protein n=1 Tax=Brenneria goodwinii TaxID=1109412 RepID=A0AAE8JKZ8_9GAMM|nr:hypothetical protein [Brenneria goodwinii]ATA26475.1 hypothetical protein AWC36_21525 [Brenneria goodwinii]RLM16361.1 hypothetical protein BIY26_22390 [Brenneria goodwinii]